MEWAITGIPGGAIGCASKLYCPLHCAQADNLGLALEPLIRLSVNSAWKINLHQRCSGKSGGHELSPAMRWFLAVLMARSAAFRLWHPGGTSWNSISLSVMNCFAACHSSPR